MGMERNIPIQQLSSWANLVSLVSFDQDSTLTAATIRAQLGQQGMSIGSLDGLIAETAVALQATLVTHNVREFSRIAGLALSDWYW